MSAAPTVEELQQAQTEFHAFMRERKADPMSKLINSLDRARRRHQQQIQWINAQLDKLAPLKPLQ